MIGGSVEEELHALLRIIFDLQAPEEEARIQVKRPESLNILESRWFEDLVNACVEGVLLSFDLRRKSEDDDLKEIDEWKKPAIKGGWVERRKNHRLRIRTMVDDLFEKNLPLADVPASIRAWKLQVADECANTILERFHIRPSSSGPWASHHRMLCDMGKNLEHALSHRDLFLMTGRIAEAKAMEVRIRTAYETMRELMQQLEEIGLSESKDLYRRGR